jgi:uncharacterized surface protein with fasciclin (FAS1) repeats
MIDADIVETAAAAGNFNTLVAAVEASGLADTLKGPGPFTLFAPVDEAFAGLYPGTLEALLRPENRDILRNILEYHVVKGRLTARDMARLHSTGTVQGQSVAIRTVHGEIMVESAQVIKPDIVASNGTIHVVDTVILPK